MLIEKVIDVVFCVFLHSCLSCLFNVMQNQESLSLFLLSASPPGPSILSQLKIFTFFLVQEAIPSRPYHIPPTPFCFLVSLQWC